MDIYAEINRVNGAYLKTMGLPAKDGPLTDPVRAYLKAARRAQYRHTEVILDLTKSFGLTPQEAGVALAQDVREVVSA